LALECQLDCVHSAAGVKQSTEAGLTSQLFQSCMEQPVSAPLTILQRP